MGPGVQLGVGCHGLAPCRACSLPVAAPLALLERELFHLSRCPHCRVLNPHPQEALESAHTRRTAVVGGVVLLASVAAILLAPMELVWSRLHPYV